MQVITFAGEEGMIFDMQNYVQVPGWSAELPNFSPTRKPNARTIFYPGRNFSIDRALTEDSAFALAFRTRISDDTA